MSLHGGVAVLTRDGWKALSTMRSGDELVQSRRPVEADLAMAGGPQFSWTGETTLSKRDEREVVRVMCMGIDLRVTHDHQMYTFNKSRKYKVIPAVDLGAQATFVNAGTLESGEDPEAMDLCIAVAVNAVGSVRGDEVYFTTQHIDILRGVLAGCGCSWVSIPYPDRYGRYRLQASKDGLKGALDVLDGIRLPWSWLGFSYAKRCLAVETFRTWSPYVGKKMFWHISKNEQSIDVLQAIATTLGHKTRKVKIDGRRWRLTIRDQAWSRCGAKVRHRNIKLPSEVVDVSVPTGHIVVRDGGIPVIVRVS